MIGYRLAQFRITAKLGKGGMGEVWRAEDTKLGREVAIKVLPEALTAEPELLARFGREARVLAALNHPNIAAIYEVGEAVACPTTGEPELDSASDRLMPTGKRQAVPQRDLGREVESLPGAADPPVHFLVMEVAEGETLAELIARGPLSVDVAKSIALQIATALEAAHGQGIVHRDLKPANVKVTDAGEVKVLDFGLAKVRAKDPVEADELLTQSPTLRMTAAGVLLGTAGYMSPEQARGQEVDQQADIWAFGVVLFEMLTGRRAFGGVTATDTIAAVLKESPNLDWLPEGAGWRIREVLEKCLEKDPRRRLHDIRDARADLERADEDPAPRSAGQLERRRSSALLVVVGLVLGALAAWLAKTGLEPSRSRRSGVLRSHIELPPEQTLLTGFASMVDLSPDGGLLVYAAKVDGISQLWLRDLATYKTEKISGTEGAVAPFFSPDGHWLAFHSQGKLVRVRVASGTPLPVTSTAHSGGGTWGPDGNIVFMDGRSLLEVPASGGEAQVIATPEADSGIIGYHRPSFLPHGRGILFVMERGIGPNPDDIGLLDMETGTVRTLLEGGGGHPLYVHSGHLLYGRSTGLLAVPFDIDAMVVNGDPVSVVEDGDAYQYAVSSTGTLVYRALWQSPGHLVWVSREGEVERVSDAPRAFAVPEISPDGTRVAMEILDSGQTNIWILDLERKTLTRLTFDEASQPVWNPVNDRIAYVGVGRAIAWRPADGSGGEEVLIPGGLITLPTSWSPDGRRLFIMTLRPGGSHMDIAVLDLDEASKPKLLAAGEYRESEPVISPDGRWLAYVSDESGRPEVYVRPGDGSGGRWQVSTSGGSEPRWSRAGDELFFRHADEMMACRILAEEHFRAGTPESLFELPMRRATPELTNYDVAADGRFLMVQGSPTDRDRESLRLVVHWHEELLTLAPHPEH